MKHPDELARVLEEIEMDLRKGNIDFKQADAGRAAALAVSYRLVPKLDAALAACAEMREAAVGVDGRCRLCTARPREHRDNCALSRTDLGRGMVVVPREMVERIGKYAREDRMVTPGSTRLARLLADLDALIKKGGW